MWTAASFSTGLLLFVSKYIEGTIFVHMYFEGLSGIVGYLLAAPLYRFLKTKISFIISFVITLIGAILILLYQLNVIKTSDGNDRE